MQPITVYFAHSLTNASKVFSDMMARLKSTVEEKHPDIKILDFFGLGEAPSPSKVYLYDMQQVATADLVVVVCDEDTWGGGMEFHERVRVLHRPTLCVAHKDRRVTRMFTGPCELYPEVVILRRYENILDVIDHIKEAIVFFKIGLAIHPIGEHGTSRPLGVPSFDLFQSMSKP